MNPDSPGAVVASDVVFFFFNDTATTEIYTLSLHDALPISRRTPAAAARARTRRRCRPGARLRDRKSTRLNSSHGYISYAVFCLKKKRLSNRVGKTEGLLRLRLQRQDVLVESPWITAELP